MKLLITTASAPQRPKRERDWRLHCSPYAQNCHQCGRVIVPWADCFFDMTSGHIVRHVECHEKAEAK